MTSVMHLANNQQGIKLYRNVSSKPPMGGYKTETLMWGFLGTGDVVQSIELALHSNLVHSEGPIRGCGGGGGWWF